MNAQNQVTNFTVAYTDEEKIMGFSRHTKEIRWKILEIMWCDKPNKLASSAGEPVFLLWSEHITEWENRDATNITYVHVAYPRWKFIRESMIKAVMHDHDHHSCKNKDSLKYKSKNTFSQK